MFDFIEIDNDSKLTLNNHINIDIPEEQYISLLDLKIIEPDKNLLRTISKSIINKYGIIPLFVLEHSQKPNIPSHLKSQYWGFVQNKNNKKYMYIALESNLDSIILNMIQNITNYSIVSVPVKKETVIDFYKSEIKKNEEEDIYDLKSFIKDNALYILFFFFIVILLILFKLYI